MAYPKTAIPAARQLEDQDWGFGLFLHFGIGAAICHFPLLAVRRLRLGTQAAPGPVARRALDPFAAAGGH